MKRFLGWIFVSGEAVVALCVVGWWIGAASEAARLRNENAELARYIEENASSLRNEGRVLTLLKKMKEEAIPNALHTLCFSTPKPPQNSTGTYFREQLEKMKDQLRKKAKKLSGLRNFPRNFGLDELIEKEMTQEQKTEFACRLAATEYLLTTILKPGLATVASVRQLKSGDVVLANDLQIRKYPIEIAFEARLDVAEQLLAATCLNGRFLLLERLEMRPAAKEGFLKVTAVLSALTKAVFRKAQKKRRPTGRRLPHIFRRRRY